MSVARTTLLLVPVAIVARGTGFVVPILIAGWFGVRAETDAFFFALSVPSVLLVLAANAVGTVVVPPLAEIRVRAPGRLAGVVAGAALASAALSTAVGVAFALVVPLLMPTFTNFDASTQALAAKYTWMLLPFVFFVGALSVVRAACEGMGAFRLAGLSPIARAATVLATVWLGWDLGPSILPVGMGAGALVEFAWLAGVLMYAGVPLAKPVFPDESVAALLALGPVLLGEAMVALNLVVDKAFAAGLADGSVTVLEYADRARLVPQTLLEATLLPVAFQTWARSRALGDRHSQVAGARQALRWVLLIAPPALAGMVVGRQAIVRLLFVRGEFPEARVVETANTMAMFVPAVLMSLVGALVVKAHIVAGRYTLVMRLGVLSMVLNAGLNTLLREPFGTVGLAAATSITTTVVTLLSWLRLGVGVPAADSLAMLTVATAAAVLLAPLDPPSVADAQLWLCAMPFVALLAIGAARARRSE